MVRDAYSAGSELQPHPADGGTQDQPLELRGNAANLTQELAQLLAASIAQGQASRRVGTPTGAELASLAAMVSASQAQRGVTPGFKDGLSSLNYTPPPQPVMPSPAVQLTEHHDDEPMPIPSTWRQPTVSDDDRWYRQQLGAAVLGLVAGLMVVVPAVLWLTGWLGGPSRNATASRQAPAYNVAENKPAPEVRTPVVKVVPVEKTEVVTQYAASLQPRPVPAAPPPAAVETPHPVVVPPAVVRAEPPPRPRVEDLLAQAEHLIENGDILGARGMLAASEPVAPGPIMFALAETYDPNMLAAWGTRGVTADVTKAKSLYARARDLGITRAQMRLDQLR